MVNKMKFKYKCYYKLKDIPGYSILIDDNETIEICELDYNGQVIDNKYIFIPKEIKDNIFNMIKNSKEIMNMSSYIFSYEESLGIEQEFYFELDNINRKIESNCINENNKSKESLILVKLFNSIKCELRKIGVNIDIIKMVSFRIDV